MANCCEIAIPEKLISCSEELFQVVDPVDELALRDVSPGICRQMKDVVDDPLGEDMVCLSRLLHMLEAELRPSWD